MLQRIPLLSKGGVYATKERTGWFVQSIQWMLNQPPRLRPLRWLRILFINAAATPPFPRRGI